MYKLFSIKPDTRLGKFGIFPASKLNHILVSEEDLQPIIANVDTSAIKIYDMEGDYYEVKEGKLEIAEDPDGNTDPKELPPALEPMMRVEAAPSIDATTGKPFPEDKPKEEKEADVPPLPPVEHNDDMTPGEKMKLAEDRANNA
jgi:hypothetical protein